MINIFKRLPVYIKIYANKVEITNLKTDHTVSRSSLKDFSSDRLLVAEFNIAESLIRDILKEMGIGNKNLKIIIQQIDSFEKELFETEKRILRDLAEQAGGTEIYLVNRKKVMNKEEVNDFLLTA
jgi:hypothetical protein